MGFQIPHAVKSGSFVTSACYRIKLRPLYHMKKILISLLALFTASVVSSQLPNGSQAPDVSFEDLQGNPHSLYTYLNAGNIVVLNFFAAWDSYSWDYQQSGELESFYASTGPLGSDQVRVFNVESESSNTSGLLAGPQSLSGDQATDTYGDWLTGSSIPFVDNAALADSFDIGYLPTVLVICPDGLVWESGQFSSQTLEDQINGVLCTPLFEGFNPAIIQPHLLRACGSNTADLIFTLKNLGTETLSDITFQITNVAGEPQALWTGTLPSYQSNEIQVSGLELINDDPVGAYILTVNDNSSDDSLSVRSAVGYSFLDLRLELALDNYPEEFSLEIRDSDDSLIYWVDSLDVPYEYINDTISLPFADCYTMTLYDESGDGLHGSQWGGYDGLCRLFSLDEDGNVSSTLYDYDGSYNFSAVPNTPGSEQVVFEAGSALQIIETRASLSGSIYPNPAESMVFLELSLPDGGDLLLNIYNAAGQMVRQEVIRNPMPGVFKKQIELDSLNTGFYLLQMMQSGRSSSFRFFVEKE